jgi:D-threo-aldose 1-dehydrogenase
VRHADTLDLTPAGPTVSRLGLGASAIGGLFEPVGDEEARAVVAAALELGLRYVDTAPLYGLGESERRVGEVLAQLPRGDYTVSTKVGRLLRSDPPDGERLPAGMWRTKATLTPVLDFSRDGVRRSLEESLERLGLDRVDLVFVHDPDGHLDQAVAEALPALAELRDEGVVAAIGVGMTDARALTRIVSASSPDCILVAGRYTLLDQSARDELLPLCEREGVSVVVGGVFNSGVLADPSGGARYDYVAAPDALVRRATCIAAVCERHGVALPAAALQFPLRHRTVSAVLTGVRSVAELEANVRHFDAAIPDELWLELEEERLLDAGATLPEAAAR